jgi:hypothetical protein
LLFREDFAVGAGHRFGFQRLQVEIETGGFLEIQRLLDVPLQFDFKKVARALGKVDRLGRYIDAIAVAGSCDVFDRYAIDPQPMGFAAPVSLEAVCVGRRREGRDDNSGVARVLPNEIEHVR